MWSVPSRRSDASAARWMYRREPRAFQSGPLLPPMSEPNFVATIASSRRVPKAAPSSSSDRPCGSPYESAVSNRLIPTSSAVWTASSTLLSSIRRPKLLQPTPTTETARPEPPSRRKRMSVTTCDPMRRPAAARSLARTLAVVETGEILQRAADGGRISAEEALILYTDAPFHALGEAADAVRRRRYPDNIVTYLIDRNINYTNVCVTACKFCAFYRGDPAPLLRGGRAGRDPGDAAGRPPPGLRRGVLRGVVLGGQGCLPPAGDPLDRTQRDHQHVPGLGRLGRGGDPPHPRRWAGLDRGRGRGDAAGPSAYGHRAAQGVGRAVAGGHGDRAPARRGVHGDHDDGYRRDQRRAHRAPADDPRRAGSHRRLPGVHPLDLPAGEQPSERPYPGDVDRVPAADRGGSAVLRQRGAPAVLVADDRQGRRPAVAAHGRRRPRLDHAGGERHLLGGCPAPVAADRAGLDDPHGGAHPGAARHALPPPSRAPDACGRPDRRAGGVALLVDCPAGWWRRPVAALAAAGRRALSR